MWEPFARNNQENFAEAGWAYRIGQKDFADVVNSDATFAVVNGVPPDEGVMVELGMAIALGKPTFLFRDDFRRATDSEEYSLNLMLFTGMPEHGWQDYYYTAPGRDHRTREGAGPVGAGTVTVDMLVIIQPHFSRRSSTGC